MADMRASWRRLTGAILATMAWAWLLVGCTATPDSIRSAGVVTFAEHQREAFAQMRSRRHFQTQDREAELAWNGPGEWRPASVDAGVPPGRGILLVHGLGDSPWSFHDLAPELAAQDFLVRTVLLPGHGTRPDDLVDVTLEQWRQVVHEQVAAMQRDIAGPVYLGGFSTGANLVLEAAYANPKIAGLVLLLAPTEN